MAPFLLVDLLPAEPVQLGLDFALLVENPLLVLYLLALDQRQQQLIAHS